MKLAVASGKDEFEARRRQAAITLPNGILLGLENRVVKRKPGSHCKWIVIKIVSSTITKWSTRTRSPTEIDVARMLTNIEREQMHVVATAMNIKATLKFNGSGLKKVIMVVMELQGVETVTIVAKLQGDKQARSRRVAVPNRPRRQ